MFLTPRQAQFAFVPVLSLVMSGVISLVMTALHANGSKAFVAAWLSGWLLAFIVALPVALVVVPIVRTVLWRLTRPVDIPSAGVKIPVTGQ